MGYDVNNVVIQCRLCKDPELKITQSGKKIANFSVAVGAGKDKVSFIDVQAWEKKAEFATEYLKKGSAVIITGSLDQQRWQDQSGGNRSKIIINAATINFQAGGKKEEADTSYAGDPTSSDPMKKAGLIPNEPEEVDTSLFADEDIPF